MHTIINFILGITLDVYAAFILQWIINWLLIDMKIDFTVTLQQTLLLTIIKSILWFKLSNSDDSQEIISFNILKAAISCSIFWLIASIITSF